MLMRVAACDDKACSALLTRAITLTNPKGDACRCRQRSIPFWGAPGRKRGRGRGKRKGMTEGMVVEEKKERRISEVR